MFAAVASLESGANSNDAILEKNDAVLSQSKASNAWALYQAKVVRATVLHGESEFAAASNADQLIRTMPYWPRARYLELAPAYWAQTRARLDPVELVAELGFVTAPPVLVGIQRDYRVS